MQHIRSIVSLYSFKLVTLTKLWSTIMVELYASFNISVKNHVKHFTRGGGGIASLIPWIWAGTNVLHILFQVYTYQYFTKINIPMYNF